MKMHLTPSPHITTPPPPAWTSKTNLGVGYTLFWPYRVNVAAIIQTHENTQHFLQFVIWYCCACVSHSHSFPFLADRSSTQSSTFLFAFRDRILKSLLVMIRYLSYCLFNHLRPLSADLWHRRSFSSTPLSIPEVSHFSPLLSPDMRHDFLWKSQTKPLKPPFFNIRSPALTTLTYLT